jgi:hypothetical protein
MLTMTARTKLTPMETVNRAYQHFAEENGLDVVEIMAHLHAKEGFTEIHLSSGKLVGNKEYESRDLLQELVGHLEETYGLKIVHYLLHMHSVPDESVGHLTVMVDTGSPTEVRFASEACDQEVRAFASSLPKA